ncbi:hypothetical protein [Streptomyces sp. NPDC018693]
MERTQGPGMTMRVHTVNRYGTITADRGTRAVTPAAGPLPARPGTYYPPCQCPSHRAGVTR